MTTDDDPVARPTLTRGELFIFAEEDLADASAELYAWVREIDGVSEADAEEMATMMYELLTEGWATALDEP